MERSTGSNEEIKKMSIGDLVQFKRIYEEKLQRMTQDNEELKTQLSNEQRMRSTAEALKENEMKNNEKLRQTIQEKELKLSQCQETIKVTNGEKISLKQQLEVKNELLKEKLSEVSHLKLSVIKLEKKNDKVVQMLDQKMDSILNKTDESLKTMEIIQRKDVSKEVLDGFEESKEELINSFEKNSGDMEELKQSIREMNEQQEQERKHQKELLELHRVIIEQMREERMNLMNGIKGALGINKECNSNEIIEEVMKIKQKSIITEMENNEMKRDIEKLELEIGVYREQQTEYAEIIFLAEGILKRDLKK